MLKQKLNWFIVAGVASLATVAQAHPGHDHTPLVFKAAGLAFAVVLIAGPLVKVASGFFKRSASQKITSPNR